MEMTRKKTESKKDSSFFTNRDCQYYPCHETDDPDDFNCLFCYCPLYVLGRKCGGDFYYNEKNRKVCTGCLFPHKRENYGRLLERYDQILEVLQREDNRI